MLLINTDKEGTRADTQVYPLTLVILRYQYQYTCKRRYCSCISRIATNMLETAMNQAGAIKVRLSIDSRHCNPGGHSSIFICKVTFARAFASICIAFVCF